MIKLSKSCIGGTVFLCVGIYMLVQIPNHSSLSFIMPFYYGVLLIALSAVLIIRGIVRRDEKDMVSLSLRGLIGSPTGKMLLYLVFILAYIILIKIWGIVATSLLFIVGSYYYMGIRSWKSYLVAVVIFGLCYLLFSTVLNVRFPHGFLY